MASDANRNPEPGQGTATLTESFEAAGVSSCLEKIMDSIENFSKILKDISELVTLLVEHDDSSGLVGNVGKKFLELWSKNSSTFPDFSANFEKWISVVSVISANNENFMVNVSALYRSDGSNLDSVVALEDTSYDPKKTYDFSTESIKMNTDYFEIDQVLEDVYYIDSAGELSNGTKNFTFKGLYPDPYLNKQNVFVDDEGFAYCLIDGVMHPIHYRDDSAAYFDGGHYKWNEKTITAELLFPDENGEYTVVNRDNSTRPTSLIDPNASLDSTVSYGSSVGDYTDFNPDTYEGDGKTIYYSNERPITTSDQENAKEMMTTSAIDVRDSLRDEAEMMNLYLDSHPNLDSDQIAAIEEQISLREQMADTISGDVQFGGRVEDGVIGDAFTNYVSNDRNKRIDYGTGYGEYYYDRGYNAAIDRIKSYSNDGFDVEINGESRKADFNDLKTLDQIVNGE